MKETLSAVALTLLLGGPGSAQSANLSIAQAHWVSRDTIAWKGVADPSSTFRLHFDPDGTLALHPEGITGGRSIVLTYDPAGLGQSQLERFPHLRGYAALRISTADVASVPSMLRGQVAISVTNARGALVDATGIQIPGVLDDLFTYRGELGVVIDGDETRVSVWAPTARSVRLMLFPDARPSSVATPQSMTFDATTGVWTGRGPAAWRGKYYQYEVEVFAPTTAHIERNLVTDPYSVSLSTNSVRSQIVDLADPKLAPRGWGNLDKPPLDAPEDTVVYELHLRDFSISDETVKPAHRGTYLAFTETGSNGMKHLRSLARAGLTHLHLLPVFDIGSIDEDPTKRREPDATELRKHSPDSAKQQEIIEPFREIDGFNWGYDPFHFTVPEGSYSTNADGAARIVEFRRMVQGLNRIGLRVVMDVVYNHTFRGGQDPKSVLDRIVPGYYHRLSADGHLETSTCCANTASEHAMMGRLIVDSVVTWAKHYKIDGFRFDLMGHHMVANMRAVRAALDGLTIARDGVDGTKIAIYGEGWNFGEVGDNARGVNATQRNLAGTGIGTFNDRLRDGVRGGRPFGGYQEQGFASGLYHAPNGLEHGNRDAQRDRLNHYADWIRLGMAGNLRNFRFVSSGGRLVSGAELDYYGQAAGYTLDPQENVVYAEAHDNETFFDSTAIKAPGISVADRARLQSVAIDVCALSQGIPFFHAGMDLLRSKSMDRDSFNSGDWFNKLDFTYRTNNWGVGLPPAHSNREKWPVMQPLLARPSMRPTAADIGRTAERFREILRVRRSTRLFRLRTAAEVESKVSFLNTGRGQIPGLIVMTIDNRRGERIDDPFDLVVVLVNASDSAETLAERDFVGARLRLHPVLTKSADALTRASTFDSTTGSFRVPARTTAVFVLPARAR